MSYPIFQKGERFTLKEIRDVLVRKMLDGTMKDLVPYADTVLLCEGVKTEKEEEPK